MAFKNTQPPPAAPDSPDQLLMDLPRRKIKGLLVHQGEIMKEYGQRAVNDADVALQLPTGSGKTLVGLMIGEWRRRKQKERVLYLCPTRQLVHQVVRHADEYGLSAIRFTGSKNSYEPSAQADYQTAEKIAVTTYSTLFNTNPYFKGPHAPHVIIVDDAHAAETYIAGMWTLRIDRLAHPALHDAVSGLLKPYLQPSDFVRLRGQVQNLADASWVDKLPTPALHQVKEQFCAILDAHNSDRDIVHPWTLVRDHLDACHVYMTPSEILLRPLLAPTWTHSSFTQAKQRIFMSATLGAGGDLERLTGRKSLTRLTVPQGWDRHANGRR